MNLEAFQDFKVYLSQRQYIIINGEIIFEKLNFNFLFQFNEFINFFVPILYDEKIFLISFRQCSFKEPFRAYSPGFTWQNLGSAYEDYKAQGINFDFCHFSSGCSLEGIRSVESFSSKNSYIEYFMFSGAGMRNISLKKCIVNNAYGASNSENFVEFFECTFGEPYSSNFRFIQNSPDGKLIFKSCRFFVAPEFQGPINHLTTFIKSEFYDFTDRALIKYRYIKSEMHKLHNEQDADLFSSLELQARKTSELKLNENFFEWVFSTFYKWFSDYGRNLGTPLLCILLVFVFFGFIFSVTECIKLVKIPHETMPIWLFNLIKNSNNSFVNLKISFVKSLFNSLGPVGWIYETPFIQPKNISALLAAFFQKVISTIMWFLWLLQIRRRFKLS